jgi:hypothetical protein
LLGSIIKVINSVRLALSHRTSRTADNFVEGRVGRKYSLHSSVFTRTGFSH